MYHNMLMQDVTAIWLVPDYFVFLHYLFQFHGKIYNHTSNMIHLFLLAILVAIVKWFSFLCYRSFEP